MANATDIVKKGVVRRTDEFLVRSTETLASPTTFYSNAMIGVDITGYFCKADDAQAWTFAGVFTQDQGCPTLPAATAGSELLELRIQQPQRFQLSITGVAVTDIGKKVYALDDQTGTLSAAATTFANFVGHVVKVESTGIALVEPCYDGIAANARYGVTKVMAATGAQALNKTDLNKTILLPNTAGFALTLPAVADTQAGDRLTFLKTTSAAAAVTLTGNASELIDASNTLATIDAIYDTAILVSTGTAWIVLARDIT